MLRFPEEFANESSKSQFQEVAPVELSAKSTVGARTPVESGAVKLELGNEETWIIFVLV